MCRRKLLGSNHPWAYMPSVVPLCCASGLVKAELLGTYSFLSHANTCAPSSISRQARHLDPIRAAERARGYDELTD